MSSTYSNYRPDIVPYEPSKTGYTYEELTDIVLMDLSISCALPSNLPPHEVRRIIDNKCLPYFYRNYQYAVQKLYYIIWKEAFRTEEYTQYRYITLPDEIQSISYLYENRNVNLYQLGINIPNLSINLGISNQPFLSSFVTTIGELGTYKTLLDSFSDMLNQLNKYTLKFHFNPLNHRLNILTDVCYDVIVEGYANVRPEYLFRDDLFIKYTTGLCKIQLANLYGRYDFTLQGNIKINTSELAAQGKEEVQQVVDEIKGQSTTGWFVMVKK